MKFKKSELDEIIGKNGELIGGDNIPQFSANADTTANNTTDYNSKVGQQPFRYDMLGRFGFTLMPFMEGEGTNSVNEKVVKDLTNLMFERYVEIIEFYYKNPNKLKIDYRKISAGDKTPQKDVNVEYANKILNIVDGHINSSLKKIDEQFHENMVESVVNEDEIVDAYEDKMTTKKNDGEINDRKIEKIAGLISKLEKKSIDKLINLLEIKRNG